MCIELIIVHDLLAYLFPVFRSYVAVTYSVEVTPTTIAAFSSCDHEL